MATQEARHRKKLDVPYDLNAAPFAEWVRQEVKGRFQGDTVRAAQAMGMSDRSVEAYVAGIRPRVITKTADLALIMVGTARLEDLWPDVFPED